jgi:hypothetical protein
MSQFWLGSVFQSLMGPVDTENLWDALGLLLKGMSGILLVMLLIFLVIVLLNKIFRKGKQEQEDKTE